MKILFLGDASNYHSTLAGAMSALGHDVTVASDGSRWMGTDRSIDLSRRQGKVGGLLLYLRLQRLCANELRGYDIVQLHDPVFAQLKPKRLRPILDRIKRNNGRLFLTSLSNDTPYVNLCLDPHGPLAYNEYRVDGIPTPYATAHPEIEFAWTHAPLSDWTRYVHDQVDGCVSALYEYHLGLASALPADRIAYAGIPVELPTATAEIGDGPIRIMAACHKGREMEKGFDILLDAINEVVAANPGKAVVDLVQNVPYNEFRGILDRAHIVVDQLYSYTPATTALMAMARGKAVVSGGEEDYYRFIGENELRPIINPDPRDINDFKHRFDALINDREALAQMMRQGTGFVARHNAADLVARRMLNFWETR